MQAMTSNSIALAKGKVELVISKVVEAIDELSISAFDCLVIDFKLKQGFLLNMVVHLLRSSITTLQLASSTALLNSTVVLLHPPYPGQSLPRSGCPS